MNILRELHAAEEELVGRAVVMTNSGATADIPGPPLSLAAEMVRACEYRPPRCLNCRRTNRQ
jgi:hypothetical protein